MRDFLRKNVENKKEEVAIRLSEEWRSAGCITIEWVQNNFKHFSDVPSWRGAIDGYLKGLRLAFTSAIDEGK